MPPGFVPPARGGRAMPPKPKMIRPRVIRPKTPDPNAVASQNAMSAFRTALAQLQSSTPAVDSAAIYAPYRASQQVTGQLGQGFQTAVQGAGQAAQDQAAAAHNAAQQSAAQFGISAGAGANPTALPGGGPDQLAQQTAAYAAAAPAATAQWQQLLERSAAAKVADAGLQRQAGLTAAEQSLSGNIPGAIQNEKQLAFQKDTQRQNIGLARTQLTEKQNEAYNRNILDQYKTQTSAETSAANRRATNQRSANSVAAANQRSANSISAANRRQDKQLQAAQKKATASGIKGISQVNSVLKGGKGKVPSSGWDVQVVALDPDTGEPSGDAKTMTLPDKRFAPKGFQIVKVKGAAVARPHRDKSGTAPSTSVSLASWNRALAILKAANPGIPQSQLLPIVGPRPKK